VTGLLTGLYTLSLFLFAPAWGWMSDRYGRRTILLIGLIGFSATILYVRRQEPTRAPRLATPRYII